MSIKRTLLCIVVFCIAICSGAHADVAVPSLERAVTDLTATLSAQETTILENNLRNFSAKTGSQLAVLIVPTTQPETIEQYSIRVVDQWKLGRKNIDDGVLLLVAKEDRTVRIEVGYGLEGALTDFTTKRIIDDFIVPEFKQGDFVGGINAGVAAIIKVIQGEQLPAPVLEEDLSFGHLLFFAIIAAVFLGSFTRSLFGKVFGSIVSATIAFFIALIFITLFGALLIALVTFVVTLLGNIGGVGRSGPFGGGSSRGGGFGGGGGRFGGGGASGKW